MRLYTNICIKHKSYFCHCFDVIFQPFDACLYLVNDICFLLFCNLARELNLFLESVPLETFTFSTSQPWAFLGGGPDLIMRKCLRASSTWWLYFKQYKMYMLFNVIFTQQKKKFAHLIWRCRSHHTSYVHFYQKLKIWENLAVYFWSQGTGEVLTRRWRWDLGFGPLARSGSEQW